jgi:hypothetical protein
MGVDNPRIWQLSYLQKLSCSFSPNFSILKKMENNINYALQCVIDLKLCDNAMLDSLYLTNKALRVYVVFFIYYFLC